MITAGLFILISATGIIFLIYSCIDCDNPIYANIFALICSSIIFGAMALAISSGGVVADTMPVAVVNQTVLNTSADLNVTSIMIIENQVLTTQIIDEGIAWIYAILSGLSIIIMVFSILRIWNREDESESGTEYYEEAY